MTATTGQGMPPKAEREPGAVERRRKDDDAYKQIIDQLIEQNRRIGSRLDDGSKRMSRIEKSLDENTAATEEVRELLTMAKTGLRVIGGIGTLALWVGKIAAALAAVYSVWYAITHGGSLPPKG